MPFNGTIPGLLRYREGNYGSQLATTRIVPTGIDIECIYWSAYATETLHLIRKRRVPKSLFSSGHLNTA